MKINFAFLYLWFALPGPITHPWHWGLICCVPVTFFFLTLSIFLLVILQHIKPVINLSPLKVEPTLQNMLPVTTHIRDPTHTKSIAAESALFIMQI